jgi:hypothetical protein
VTPANIEHVAAWCANSRLPFERRADGLWIPNSAAPRYGVLIRDVAGDREVIEWSMPFPIPAKPDCVAETQRALGWLNQWSGPGAWELLADRMVRYRLYMPAEQLATGDALMDCLRAVLDAGNAHVHALVSVMIGDEPAEYVHSSIRVETADADGLRRAAAMTVTLDRLSRWSEQLCVLAALDMTQAMSALGIAGSIVQSSSTCASVEPPPPGSSWLGLSLEHLGANAGHLSSVEVVLAGSQITHEDLVRRFGAGVQLARIHYDSPHVIAYHLRVADAPFRCSVFAYSFVEPAVTSQVDRIGLRRDSPVM